jgi:hypothetical protein
MPTTLPILEPSYPQAHPLPQTTSTLIAPTTYDACWAASEAFWEVVEGDRLAANPINRVDWTGLWGSKIHHDLTKAIADNFGFNENWSEKIGTWDNDIDKTYDPVALGISELNVSAQAAVAAARGDTALALKLMQEATGYAELLIEWHFPGAGDGKKVEAGGRAAQVKLEAAVKSRNLKDFAEALHAYQDSFSHQGLPSLGGSIPHSYGHPGNPLSTDVDDPEQNFKAARDTARGTFQWFVIFWNEGLCIKAPGVDTYRQIFIYERRGDSKPNDIYREKDYAKFWGGA